MYDRATVFPAASPRSRRRYPNSLSPSGRSSGAFARMPGGMVWSIRASRDGTPIARSISSRASGSGPMCLLLKVPGMDTLIRLLREFGVRRCIEQPVEIAGTRHLDDDHPGVVGITIDRFGTLSESRVDFNHFAADGGIQL